MKELKCRALAAWQQAFAGYIPREGTRAVGPASEVRLAELGQIITIPESEVSGEVRLAVRGGSVFGEWRGQIWQAPLL